MKLRSATLTLTVASATLAALALCSSPSSLLQQKDDVAVSVTPPARITTPPARRALSVPVLGGLYGAPAGRHLAYRLQVAQDARLVGGDGAARVTVEDVSAVGTLHLRVVARGERDVTAHVSLAPLELMAGGSDAVERAAWSSVLPALAHGFLVRWSVHGALCAWSAEALAPRARLFARALIDALAFPTQDPPLATWTATGRDGTGEYTATFAFDAQQLTLTRCKDSYRGIAGACAATPTGQASAVFDRDIGWWTRVDVDERLHLTVAEVSLRLDAHVSVTLVLTEASDEGVGDQLARDAVFTPIDSDAAAAALASARIESMQRMRLAGRNARDVVDDISAVFAADPLDGQRLHELTEDLAWLLRLRAEEVPALLALLRGRDLSENVLITLTGALGCANTPTAQAALVALLDDATVDARVREAAAIGATRVLRPEATLLQSLTQGVERVASMDGPTASGLLALGALAPQPNALLPDGRSATDALLALESRCRSLGAVDVWLQALGNAGTSAALDAAARHAQDGEEHVRAAAATAVRKLDDARAVHVLTELARDASPLVHARAVNTLAQSPASVGAQLTELWRNEPEPTRRRVVLDALARRSAQDAQARATLSQAAVTDTDPVLRAHAQRLLTR